MVCFFLLLQALRSDVTLGGCIALSSWLPFRSEYPEALTPEASTIRVFQVHGDADNVVGYHWGQGSHDLMKTFLTANPPSLMTIRGMGHSSHPSELDAVAKFISDVFGV